MKSNCCNAEIMIIDDLQGKTIDVCNHCRKECSPVDLPTLCNILTVLYANAYDRDMEGEISLIEQAYVKAKKMDRKLKQYKGNLIDSNQGEGYWIEELKNNFLLMKQGKYKI